MRRDEVLKRLAESRDKWREFSVKSLALFGSVARDEASASSDVDVLVEFEPDKPVGLFVFIALKQYLEEILGCPVDLTTSQAPRERLRDAILKEAGRTHLKLAWEAGYGRFFLPGENPG